MFPCFKNCISSNVFAWKYDPNRSQGERSGKRRKTNVGRSFRGEEETHRSISVLLVKLANVRKQMQSSVIGGVWVCVCEGLCGGWGCVCRAVCVCVPWPFLNVEVYLISPPQPREVKYNTVKPESLGALQDFGLV